jgi:hypothetical protein
MQRAAHVSGAAFERLDGFCRTSTWLRSVGWKPPNPRCARRSMKTAIPYAGLDEWDAVLDALDRAVDERTALVCWAMVDPRNAPIATHPRFLALLARLGVRQPPDRPRP